MKWSSFDSLRVGISQQERLYIDSIQRKLLGSRYVGGNEKSADNIRGEAELQLGRIHLLLGEDEKSDRAFESFDSKADTKL